MIGLEQYVKKHGEHITLELAIDVLRMHGCLKWDAAQIEKATESMVYYNVTGSTVGDMVYYANILHYREKLSKRGCIKETLEIAGKYGLRNYFMKHLLMMNDLVSLEDGKEIDLRDYI